MITYALINQTPRKAKALGATCGQEHMAPLRGSLVQKSSLSSDPIVIAMDFRGIEATNASYLKATLLWLLNCGRRFAGGVNSSESCEPGIEPFNVFPLVTNASEDVEMEIDEVFGARHLPYLKVLRSTGKDVQCAELRGSIEPFLRKTLDLLIDESASSALELHEQHPVHEITSPTAWNNRLSDLHSMRLVSRRKEGRTWIYQPIVKEIRYG